MPDADYLALGQWNAHCARCGRKFKSTRLRLDWQGYRVCERDWEPRHPQDFVRQPGPESVPEWTRPDGPPLGIPVNEGLQPLADIAQADYAIVGV